MPSCDIGQHTRVKLMRQRKGVFQCYLHIERIAGILMFLS